MSTDRLSDEQIATLRALAEQATPGPWEHVPFSDEVIEAADREHTQIADANDSVADAAYIAAANPVVLPALLAEVQEWRTALDELHVSNWIGVVDGLTPREAVRKLLEYALDQDREALRAEAQTLRAEVQASRQRWQPMATAPKDGRWVLLLWPYWCPTRPIIAKWYPANSENGRWDALEVSCDAPDGERPPAGWMPLPAPTSEDRP